MNAASSAQWPNNVVPYVLEAAFTSADRAIIAAVSILKYQAHKIRKRGVAICFDLLVATDTVGRQQWVVTTTGSCIQTTA